MSKRYRKIEIFDKSSSKDLASVKHNYRKVYIAKETEVEDLSEQVILSPATSDILATLEDESKASELKRKKESLKKSSITFPNLVESLALVKKWQKPSKTKTGTQKKGEKKSSKEGLDGDAFITDTDSKGEIILRLTYGGSNRGPDTLANLVRKAVRNGALGSYFRELAFDTPEDLMEWQKKLLEAQRNGDNLPIDELLSLINDRRSRGGGKLPAVGRRSSRSYGKRRGSRGYNELTGSPLSPMSPSDSDYVSRYGADDEYPETLTKRNQMDLEATQRGLSTFTGAKRFLLPEIPGNDYDRTRFDGWDFGTKLGRGSMGVLPELPQRASQHLERKPPNVPLEKMAPVSKRKDETCQEYLMNNAIYELFEFLTFVITLERPEKPIDFMIELVRSIKRLADIRDTTSLKMSEVEDYINTFERNPA
nr:hypothetical protein BgiMline_020685 [Biomphalaria glabrata]